MSEKRLEEVATSQNDINSKLDDMKAKQDALGLWIKDLSDMLDYMELPPQRC
jgi:hypothetical protein